MGSPERVLCFLPGMVAVPILCSMGDEAIAGEGILGVPSRLFSFGFPLWGKPVDLIHCICVFLELGSDRPGLL